MALPRGATPLEASGQWRPRPAGAVQRGRSRRACCPRQLAGRGSGSARAHAPLAPTGPSGCSPRRRRARTASRHGRRAQVDAGRLLMGGAGGAWRRAARSARRAARGARRLTQAPSALRCASDASSAARPAARSRGAGACAGAGARCCGGKAAAALALRALRVPGAAWRGAARAGKAVPPLLTSLARRCPAAARGRGRRTRRPAGTACGTACALRTCTATACG